ncbi:2-hydroxyacid dehydrogenase [Roseiterribacter gracilis]|uniref:Glycerate dehydrogenase n=1 Tax=Roseiterribacter gracilis TaxID=2812848 RepID=A0A8S8X8H7_9PROT|nr:glycerate dehydrogenase [Rhodospirillales bacterium TMPK1]
MATNEIHLLSMGQMMPAVEKQLSESFIVHRTAERPIDEIIAEHGAKIRGIATRGRDKCDDALLAKLPKLEIVSNFGVGYDSIDVPAAVARGLVVTNTPDVLNDEVADFTVGLLLSTVRELPQADAYVRAGNWPHAPYRLTQSLRDRTVGMVGMGRIGRAIAKRIAAFDVPVVYYSRRPQADVPYRHVPNLLDMADQVDTLIVIVPGGPETKHLINAEVLKALGRRGILINVARGSVVDQQALITALKDKTIHGAGLDVFADEPRVPQELIERDNAVLVPHVGSGTHHTRARMGQLVVDNLRSWFDGQGPVTPIPESKWPR